MSTPDCYAEELAAARAELNARAELKKIGDPYSDMADPVLSRLLDGDGKGAFIAWFEGRPGYTSDDWAMLLLVARVAHSGLFPDEGVTARLMRKSSITINSKDLPEREDLLSDRPGSKSHE